MFMSENQLVFIEKNEGVSKSSQRPYCMVKFANPNTYENFTLSADPSTKFGNFDKGELVKIKIDLGEMFGNTRVTLKDIIPVAVASK